MPRVNSENWAGHECQQNHGLNTDDNTNIDTWMWGAGDVMWAGTVTEASSTQNEIPLQLLTLGWEAIYLS